VVTCISIECLLGVLTVLSYLVVIQGPRNSSACTSANSRKFCRNPKAWKKTDCFRGAGRRQWGQEESCV